MLFSHIGMLYLTMQGYNSKPFDKMSSENGLRMRHPSGRETGLLMNNTK